MHKAGKSHKTQLNCRLRSHQSYKLRKHGFVIRKLFSWVTGKFAGLENKESSFLPFIHIFKAYKVVEKRMKIKPLKSVAAGDCSKVTEFPSFSASIVQLLWHFKFEIEIPSK